VERAGVGLDIADCVLRWDALAGHARQVHDGQVDLLGDAVPDHGLSAEVENPQALADADQRGKQAHALGPGPFRIRE